jgi:CelD/BcsL family acetyltransferase involved in cellulose biosynthesis
MTEANGLNFLAGWKPKPVQLRYSLSYVQLFAVSFKALEDPRPFNPDTPPVADAQLPVQQIPGGYDVIVERNRPLASPIAVIQRLPNMLRYAPRQMLHFYTDLRGGPEQAFRSMSAKTRSTLARKVRNYKEFCQGEIRWSVHKTPDEMLAYHQCAREVARKTYQERLFDSGLPDSQEFRANMLELAKRDLVRGWLLFHGEKPIAYLYTPAPDGFLVYEYLGYDPEYAQQSPGTVLQYLALESLYTDGRFPLYYWSYGESQTKKIFSTGQVLGADIYYFRPTLRNRLAVWLHYGIERLAKSMGSLLNKLQLKQRIKRWLKKQ